MTPARGALLVSILALVACSGSESPPVAEVSPSPENEARPLPNPLPEVLARVNGHAIRLTEVVPLTRDELRRFIPSERDAKTPIVLRRALRRYIDQELLLQEALARGVEADTRAIEREYDQARREHPDEEAWVAFLAQLGFEPQSFKAALRIRHTVAALIRQEANLGPVTDEEARAAFEADPQAFTPPGASSPPPFETVREKVRKAVQEQKENEVASHLVEELRARARIETFI
ncbi:MAG: SurA N-terminal domain-containing protein [Acidobacteria bacterium]|jgi:hypothetical protein|nr:SurA N-terminal domain-containing protein [Acidobacteriota bacterium]